MNFRLGNALAALGVAFIMVTSAGCSSDDCEGVSCSTGEVCEAGKCVEEENLCTGKVCPAGTGCNLENGNCANLCSLPSAPTCTAPQQCEPTTGKCADLCAGVTCESDKLACNPASGFCEQKCKPGTCGTGFECIATTGECVKFCETATKPTGKDECESGQKCQATSGKCVPLCDGVQCGYSEWCVPDLVAKKGKCEFGKPADGRPGSACVDNADCFVEGAPSNQVFECRLSMPQLEMTYEDGYCSASCSQSISCPDGSLCFDGGIGCLDTCAGNKDCRPGWMCGNVGQGESICVTTPECTDPNDCRGPGEDCIEDGQCGFGARCIAEVEDGEFTGFEGGFCLIVPVSAEDCPDGSTPVSLQSQSGDVIVCMKNCDPSLLGTCGVGETCYELTGASGPAGGGCWEAMCSKDEHCNAGSFCELASATCMEDVNCKTATPAQKAKFETKLGLSCNQTTGRYERGCSDNDQCGTTAVCSDSKCVTRCTLNNEKDVCDEGLVCHEASGLCEAPCNGDSCDNDEICDGKGHCRAACDAPVNPLLCQSGQICGADGACVAACTKATENALCGTDKVCHISSGRCMASCHEDPTVCGDEACSVGVRGTATFGVCGRTCTNNDVCKTAPTGEALTCQGASGSKSCQFTACDDDTSSTACGAEQVCLAGSCRTKTAEPDPVCTIATEADDCSGATPFCDEDADACSAKCSVDGQCGETEFCSVAGACEAKACNEEGAAACVDGLVCGAGGECIASCAAEEDATTCEGGVACDVASGLCGKSCETSAECGADLVGHALECNDDGSTKTCSVVGCVDGEDCASGTCGEDDFCVVGSP